MQNDDDARARLLRRAPLKMGRMHCACGYTASGQSAEATLLAYRDHQRYVQEHGALLDLTPHHLTDIDR